MKGNVLELAVAVIIAGAFGAVVTSFTKDVLMPPIGQLIGGVDFSELAIPLSAPYWMLMETSLPKGLPFVTELSFKK